ncbi:myomegalin isoform X5 [Gouania willdenowi]|uniref:myomegalin isoform X5 n=1 Tax=Gouania willdenowi TaxID=441366 RepID=UPI001055DDF1|nr:myomegalin isoform X5 [Gouania willdenowi]
MLDVKMKDTCRICGRELCGNQRRWIFHPTAKLNLQVLLSHALGRELSRDGRGEFACSKCTFMLDRMYRFDTVIARVEALSIERLQRLLQEKHRLRQCINGLYRKTNNSSEEEGGGAVVVTAPCDGMVDISGLTHAKYCALLQEDLVYSLYESWAEDGGGVDGHHHPHPPTTGSGSDATTASSHRCTPNTPRKCRGCSHLRVADSDYEAVCKVPRKLARSISCGPSTRYSASVAGGEADDESEEPEPASSITLVPGSEDQSRTSDSDRTLAGRASSSLSVASLETTEEFTQHGAFDDLMSELLSEEHMEPPAGPSSPGPDPSLSLTLCLLQSCSTYRPVQTSRGSRLPVLLRHRNGDAKPRLSPCRGRHHQTLDPPVIKLNAERDQDLNLGHMENLLEDVYRECPPPLPHQSLVEERQSQLSQYECVAGQCVSELHKAQLQVQSLQAKVDESETNNLKLQEKLDEMESELRLLRQAAQSSERTIQGLTESISTKDGEAQELYQLIEGQNATLCTLQELAHRNQLSQRTTPAGEVGDALTLSRLQGELVGVQSSLFSLGLELEASQRSLRHSQRQGEDVFRFKDRLNSDLQEALQHREETEKHNQDLRCSLHKLRLELEAKEAQLKENEVQGLVAEQEKDRTIAQLQSSVQDKQRLLEEYSEMLELTRSSKPRDALLDKMRERIKERDKALERSIDEKFRTLEDHDAEVRSLQLALREKERDLERLRCILSNNEQTLTSVDAVLRAKELELEQAADAYRNLQWLRTQSEQEERHALTERDAIISQLQDALRTHSQETQALTAGRAPPSPGEAVEELKARLALKEKLIQELLSDRRRQSEERHAEVQELLNALGSKDQYLQDSSHRLSQVIAERTAQLQELRAQLSLREQELMELRREKEREKGEEGVQMRALIKEKEALIQELMQAQESQQEVKVLQEELQLLLKKDKEAQEELCALRSALAQQASHNTTTDHKVELDQLVSQYNQLNDALRTEKSLYQSLTHAHSSSSAHTLALHTELDSVQALRGQLDEVLSRARHTALTLQQRQPDFGELSSDEEEEEEGDDEEGSSEEFSDSIEDDNDEEEEEDHRASARPQESDGCVSGAQMRTLHSLREENQSLEEEEEEQMCPLVGGKRGPPCVSLSDEPGKRQCVRPSDTSSAGDGTEVDVLWQDIDEGLREQASRLTSDLALSQQENRDLLEKLMVSEATVQAQSEQLKDYRDLLKTSVQQASKQVQVDLQDLGYETCGRSENEAEREDTSSPEFDDLEMCTSLSHHQDGEGVGGGWLDPKRCGPSGDESALLHHLVQDLRSQLSRCHKVIRGLQIRVRSLSTTSDYASSLERTPCKVNWAFETSLAPSAAEEDEGWMSDTQGTVCGSKPSSELQELVSRVASLEAQLKNKGKAEEEKCPTWPDRKYNSLIQAQARELSHLRQRMREGQGVIHILSQHLGDTTKAFEELLRANDIDYYMGQSFREQLAHSSALVHRVGTKISSGESVENSEDKIGHELLTIRLSKELQQKDQIISSLHTKLQQRVETPSSCHALSETTEPSDRTSLASDEYQTNEDLDMCSDLDAGDFQHQEPEADVRPSSPSPSRHGFLTASSSCPNMLSSAFVPLSNQPGPVPFREPVRSSLSTPSGPGPRPRSLTVIAVRPELEMLYKRTNELNGGFSVSPSSKPLFELSNYSQLSHPAFQQYPLGGIIPPRHPMTCEPGRPVWDVGNTQTTRGGVNLMEEHLQEVRYLRQRLDESIRTNERLRQQLEEKLATVGREGGAATNIYIQGLDTVTQLSNEIRILKEENVALRSRLQSTSDTSEEVAQLRETLLSLRARVKQSELEAEQWKEELRRLQTHSQDQGQLLHTLRQERQDEQDNTNRLQHELSLLQQQLCESRRLVHSLQSELHVYDRVCSSSNTNKGYLCELPALPVELRELLQEVRSLRAQLQNSVQENSALKQLELHKQLEQKLGVASPRTPCLSALSASPQRENFCRRLLLHDPSPSPPVRDIGLFNCGSPGLPSYSDLEDNHSTANDALDPHSELEGEAPDGSFANRNGRHAVGHVDDYSALQQQVLEGRGLVHNMEATLEARLSPLLLEGRNKEQQVLDYECVRTLLSNTKTLRQILEESSSLLKMFWRAALPSSDPSVHSLKREQSMQEELLSLKLRVSEQEEVLKGTIQRLRSTSRSKESMEHFIVSQLSRTRDVMKKARTNLEKNELRLSSLSASSSSHCAAEDSGGPGGRRPAAGGRVLTALRKRSNQCLL